MEKITGETSEQTLRAIEVFNGIVIAEERRRAAIEGMGEDSKIAILFPLVYGSVKIRVAVSANSRLRTTS